MRFLSLVAVISFTGCAVSEADQASWEDSVIQELQVGGKKIMAASRKTSLGWRTTLTDDSTGTVYADIHVADSDGIWTGTIAGIDLTEPAATPVDEWRRAYESEAGQIVMAASLQARSLADESEPELMFTVGSLAGILGGQAEVAQEPDSIFGFTYAFVTSRYLICTPLHPRRYGYINAQYGAQIALAGHGTYSNNWNTSAYYTFKASTAWPSIGKITLYRDSRGKVAWWATGCHAE